MNINKMINMLLQQLSLEYETCTLLEFDTYKEGKVYQNYKVKIGNISEEFRSKKKLLLWLKDWK